MDVSRAVMFQIRGPKKKYWYLRIKRQNKPGYFQRSTGETNKITATRVAETLYRQFIHDEIAGVVPSGRRNFNRLFVRFVNEWDDPPLTESRKATLMRMFSCYFSEFFEKYSVQQVDTQLVREYIDWRREYWERKKKKGLPLPNHYRAVPSNTTLRGEKSVIVQFLGWCAYKSILPYAPKIHIRYFGPGRQDRYNQGVLKRWGHAADPHQLDQIEARLRAEFDTRRKFVDALAIRRLYYFIKIVRHCNLRPGTEATSLQWKHIKFRKSRKYPGVSIPIISVPKGKVGARTAIGDLYSAAIFDEWRLWLRRGCISEWGVEQSYGEDDDHIFIHYQGGPEPVRNLSMMFSNWIKKFNLQYNDAGKSICLYSIRSSEINRMIRTTDWPMAKIADAFGTSTEAISRRYNQAFMDKYSDEYVQQGSIKNPQKVTPAQLERAEYNRLVLNHPEYISDDF